MEHFNSILFHIPDLLTSSIAIDQSIVEKNYRKYRWIGYVLRIEDENISSIAFE
jgi:hypothetical protein